MTRWQIAAHLIVERHKADGVALQMKKEAERGGERGGVLGLGVTQRTVGHGSALVRDEVAAQIGFVLESFQEKAIAPGEHAPVKIAKIIARRVRPVLREFDGKPM